LRYSPSGTGFGAWGITLTSVVTFADKPWRYVFWRGTRYLPSLSRYGRDGIWSNDQGPERYEKQCYEHMSDMLCRFSNARIIHRSDARVVCIGGMPRLRLITSGPRWTQTVGDWTDEYWTIYPDGIPSATSWCTQTDKRIRRNSIKTKSSATRARPPRT